MPAPAGFWESNTMIETNIERDAAEALKVLAVAKDVALKEIAVARAAALKSGNGEIISEKTPVRIGLLLTVALLLTGGFGTSIWWAATISTKLDAIIISQSVQTAAVASVQTDVSDLKAWRKLIDTSGSPQVTTLASQINELKRAMEVHIAQTEKPK
jgi:hypothetical protein